MDKSYQAINEFLNNPQNTDDFYESDTVIVIEQQSFGSRHECRITNGKFRVFRYGAFADKNRTKSAFSADSLRQSVLPHRAQN